MKRIPGLFLIALCAFAAAGCTTRPVAVSGHQLVSDDPQERAERIDALFQRMPDEGRLRFRVADRSAGKTVTETIDLEGFRVAGTDVCGRDAATRQDICLDVINIEQIARLDRELGEGAQLLLLIPAIPVLILLSPGAIAMGGGG